MKILEQVSEFHNLFQHPVLATPQIPNQQRRELRKALISEEFMELCEAIDNGDIVGVSDALCDLQYVLSGTVLEFGLKELFPAMFDEVQRSNMSKACDSLEEANATIEKYKNDALSAGLAVPKMHYEYKEGKYLVYRTHDRKTLKSINYSPANLKQFLK